MPEQVGRYRKFHPSGSRRGFDSLLNTGYRLAAPLDHIIGQRAVARFRQRGAYGAIHWHDCPAFVWSGDLRIAQIDLTALEIASRPCEVKQRLIAAAGCERE